jgi:putative ABC transport system permease protein
MLQPRWRKIIRDLWSSKLRTILVVLSIAIGVFAIGVIASARVILSRDMNQSYAATNPHSATIFPDHFNEELVQSVRNMPNVREAAGRRSIRAQIAIGPNQWRDINLYAVPDYNDIRVNRFWSEAGAWPPPDHEVLIERASIDYLNVSIGATVQIKMNGDTERTMRVAGAVYNPEQPEAGIAGLAFGYISLDTLKWLGEARGLNELLIVVEGDATDPEHIQAVADNVKDRVERSGRTVYGVWTPQPGKHPVDEILQPLLLILGFLGTLSLFLSSFLVINTISAILTQHVRQIGMMKAIGARSSQLVTMYIGMVVILGLLSLLVAVPLGALGAWALVNYVASLINFNVTAVGVPLQVLALEIAVGVLVPLLAAFWPVLAGARVTVREAISSYGVGKGHFGRSRFDQLLQQVRGLSRPLLLSLRNTFRRRGRLALTLITLTMGGAIFISVFSVRESLFHTLDDASNYWKFDVFVGFDRPYRTDLIEAEALQVPGVAAAESWGVTSARRVQANGVEGRNMTVIAPPAATELIDPVILQGRWLVPDDENAIVINSDVLTDEPDIALGQMVDLTMRGETRSWQVVGIVQGYLTGPRIFMNYPYFARIVGEVGRASSVRVVTTQHDSAFQEAIATDLTNHFKQAGVQVNSTATIVEELAPVVSQFNILVVFLLIMALLLALVGGLGLMGTMSINVLERTREIGVLRAVGASDTAVQRIVVIEGVLIGGISWLIGALLALPLSRLMSDQVGIAFIQEPLSYTFSSTGVAIWLSLVVVLAAIASFLPAWNASRLSVRDVLAYE